MRERPRLDLPTLKARCPVVVDRPLATVLHYGLVATLAVVWPVVVVMLARAWPWPAKLLAGIVLLTGLLPLVAIARHVRRAGAFRLAADEQHVYFRESLEGRVRALEWRRCQRLETIPALGEHAVRLEFERHPDEGSWVSLCHARVFVRDSSVEIVAMHLSAASSLALQLQALRQDGARRDVEPPIAGRNQAAA